MNLKGSDFPSSGKKCRPVYNVTLSRILWLAAVCEPYIDED
jgi:hypothetical protein